MHSRAARMSSTHCASFVSIAEMRDAQLAAAVGSTPVPPKFALGYHQCRWNYRNTEDVYAVHRGFEEHDMPEPQGFEAEEKWFHICNAHLSQPWRFCFKRMDTEATSNEQLVRLRASGTPLRHFELVTLLAGDRTNPLSAERKWSIRLYHLFGSKAPVEFIPARQQARASCETLQFWSGRPAMEEIWS